jgi:hypothetical protein
MQYFTYSEHKPFRIITGNIFKEATMDKNENKFHEHRIQDSPSCAIHIGWDNLADVLSKLLSDLFGREIAVDSIQEEYYCWKINFADTPLDPKELESLFELAEASDWDREENEYRDGFPISELCQGFCNKIMDKLLPFSLMLSRADEDGVWFIGDSIPSQESVSPKINNTQERCLEKLLPDGTKLIVETWDEPDYPGMRLLLRNSACNEELLCFAEFNIYKPEGRQLCIAAYTRDVDEPVYYESYNDKGWPSPNN